MTFRSLLFVFLLLLCQCAFSDENYSNPDQLLNKTLHLPQDMALAEVQHINPLDYNGYWVLSFPQKGYVNNYINHMMPTLAAFNANPPAWQKWEGNLLTGWSRLVGVLETGTTFHVIEVLRKLNAPGYWVTIEIESGQYKGKTAMVANYQNLS